MTEIVWVLLHQGTCDYWVRPDLVTSILSLLGGKQRILKTRVYLINGHEAEVTETAKDVRELVDKALKAMDGYWKSEDED